MIPFLSATKSDLFRITGFYGNILHIVLNLYKPEFRFLFFLRAANYHYINNNRIRLLFYRHYSIKYGYEIPYQCEIKKGLKLIGFDGVAVNPLVRIGKNCTL